MKMPKKMKLSYLLNFLGLVLLFSIFVLMFESKIFGTSTTYIKGIFTTACYTIIMVTSLNLVVGCMGEFSLGHAGFVSVGAYFSAITSNALAGRGIPDLLLLIIALIAGGLAAGLTGILVGIPALRLRGDYLAIVTVAFAEIIRVAFCNFEITGGGKTMSGIAKLADFYWAFWIMGAGGVAWAMAMQFGMRPEPVAEKSEKAKTLANEMTEKYNVPAIPQNILETGEDDIKEILQIII